MRQGLVNTIIIVDFYGMTWIDANLTALLQALEYRLQYENNVSLSTDFDFLFSKFHVLFRNGCLQHKDFIVNDLEKTTIPSIQFHPSATKEFSDYIQMQLMGNMGMNYIEKKLKNQIHSDLYEVFQNILKHARTELPCFICGQYYPSQKCFMLTIVDLGVGFLLPYYEATKGQVRADIDAIKLAISGRSSKVINPAQEIGGLGLSGILDYCQKNKGVFQIYSGTDYWGTDLDNYFPESYVKAKYNFKGSVLNMAFKVAS